MIASTLLQTISLLFAAGAAQPDALHPAVNPASAGEPNLVEILTGQWGLDLERDLRNPALPKAAPAGVFIKANKDKPVLFAPVVAYGVDPKTHGGWYPAGPKASDVPADPAKARVESWTYAFKNPASESPAGKLTPPPLQSGSITFDPGATPFGVWISNDSFSDGGVYSQPAAVAKANRRLSTQPYKALIYPTRDAKSKQLVPDSYLLCWEYSTNDDFQDTITRIDNVRLLPADPSPLETIFGANPAVNQLARGFQFTEGPAWDRKTDTLYFSDLPPKQIIAFKDGQARVASQYAGQTNGLMFDRDGKLIGCENTGRRVSRGLLTDKVETLAGEYQGKRLNSPNDLWLDADGGLYFTDPHYGPKSEIEQGVEAVYYISADKKITRVIDDLVKPNGIAISPAGDYLYVIDNGADALWRYPIGTPGKIGSGERIAYIVGPDGMTIDSEGRLYLATYRGISVLQADGKWLGLLDVPEQPANCTFGGRDQKTLLITARTSLYGVKTSTRGWHVHLDGKPAAH
jgi:gluconolactonase